MTSNDGERRDVLRRIAEEVVARVAPDVPSVRAHVGHDYIDSAEGDAVALRAAGHHYDWVAFSVQDWSMWDVHAGAVYSGDSLVVGLHAHERVFPAVAVELERAARQVGAAYASSRDAHERQYNLPPFQASSVDAVVHALVSCCRLLPRIERQDAAPAM
jgi:hypothetical protein